MTTPLSRRVRWGDELDEARKGTARAIHAVLLDTADDLDGHDKSIGELASELRRLRISINTFTGTIAASAIGVCVTIILAVT